MHSFTSLPMENASALFFNPLTYGRPIIFPVPCPVFPGEWHSRCTHTGKSVSF